MRVGVSYERGAPVGCGAEGLGPNRCTAPRLGVMVEPSSIEVGTNKTVKARIHLQTLVSYKRGFNQNYYIFTLKLLITIIMCSKFS